MAEPKQRRPHFRITEESRTVYDGQRRAHTQEDQGRTNRIYGSNPPVHTRSNGGSRSPVGVSMRPVAFKKPLAKGRGEGATRLGAGGRKLVHEDTAKGGRAFGSGPVGGKKATAAVVSKARKALPAIQKKNAAETARQRAMSPSVARGRDFAGYRKALVSANARKVQAAAAKKGGGSPLDAITSFFQGRVDLATGKAPTHISTSGNHTPVVPLVKDELRKIKKAGK